MIIRLNLSSLLFILISSFICSCSKTEEKLDFDIEYIPVKIDEDSDWSLLSKDGKIIYENEFKEQPSMVVNGFFYVKEDNGYSVYKADSDKPEIVNGLENLEYVGIMNDDLMPVTFPGKRISIVNKDGKEQFKLKSVKGKEIVACAQNYTNGMLSVVDEDNKMGFYNANGECVITPSYDFAGYFAEEKSMVCKDSVWTIIDKKGEKLFSLKKNQIPGYMPMFKNDRIIAVDKDSTFYAYNGKGEMSKLSNKIKLIVDYNDKFIIYVAKNDEQGMMSFDGNIVIRAKYKRLGFGQDDKLIALRGEDQYELLDYDGNVIEKLDCDKFEYQQYFGYIGGSDGDLYILNKDGKKLEKSKDFYEYSLAQAFPQIISCYIPNEKLMNKITELLKPEGIGDYKFGTSMSAIASSMGADINNLANTNAGNLSLPLEQHGNYALNLNLYSYQIIAFRNYFNQVLWNPNSTVDMITLFVDTAGNWGNKGVNELVTYYKNNGYVETRHVENKGKNLYILNDGQIQMFICNPADKRIVIMYGHGVSDMMANALINDFTNQTNQ